jgi:hypothetical protein
MDLRMRFSVARARIIIDSQMIIFVKANFSTLFITFIEWIINESI